MYIVKNAHESSAYIIIVTRKTKIYILISINWLMFTGTKKQLSQEKIKQGPAQQK